MRIRVMAAAVAAALGLAAPAARASIFDEARRTTREALSVKVERRVLPNGLVVLLCPDPRDATVAVSMSFRAGALFEPPGRSGLAHLVEHLLASGLTPETDYASLLETRRARYFNASTGPERMSFDVVLPAEELPVALWVAADRLATVPGLIDDRAVAQNRRVVLQERALRDVDVPYGLASERLSARLFPAPHPLHAGVIGAPGDLERVTAEDVRAFVAAHLVPSNGVLTVAGRFDPEVAWRLIELGVARLPAGLRPRTPAQDPLEDTYVDVGPEALGRRPRVMMGWRFPGVAQEDAKALEVGAQLLTFLTDGAWGMDLAAGFATLGDEAVFELQLTVPYDEPMEAVHRDADAFLRMLTLREMPAELVIAANLALDRQALFQLDTPARRAALVTDLEVRTGGRLSVADDLAWHWALERVALRDTARVYLRKPRVVVHARPTRPRPARAERQ